MKVAFFDRDGTIIKDYKDKEWTYIDHPVFIPGAIEILRYVQSRDYAIVIITNQYLIDEHYITFDQYHEITKQMLQELGNENIYILDIFFCPDSRYNPYNRLKPDPYMIKQAQKKYPAIDLEQSFMIGDSQADIQLALNVGIKSFGIAINHEVPHHSITYLKHISDLSYYID